MLDDTSKLLGYSKCHFSFLLGCLSCHSSKSLVSSMQFRVFERGFVMRRLIVFFLLITLQNLSRIDKVRSSKKILGIVHIFSFSNCRSTSIHLDSLRKFFAYLVVRCCLCDESTALFRKLFFHPATAVFDFIFINKSKIFSFLIEFKAFFCICC